MSTKEKSLIHRARTVWLTVFIILIGHIFLPLSFVVQLWKTPQYDFLAWSQSSFIAASYLGFVYAAGAWSWFGNVTRNVLAALLVISAIASYPRDHNEFALSSLVAFEPILSICIGVIFITLTVFALLGRRLNTEGLDLIFPLRGGTYVIGQGGSTRIVNYHVVSVSQRYALDMLKLNEAGVRARGLYPADLNAYAIFGKELISPCDAVVAAAVDGFPDLNPPERDPEHRAGNYIALDCRGTIVYLAHLMHGSVCVKPGDRVHAGQILGRVGNSGNTTEPHLHIHAEEGPYTGQFSGGPGVPLTFGGKFLVRNDRVTISGNTKTHRCI